MNDTDHPIDQRLHELGTTLRSQPCFSDSPAAQEILRTQRPIKKIWQLASFRIAACFLIGAMLWLALPNTESLSYADVQKAVATKPWVLIRYDDGAEEWINLSERRSFYTYKDKLNFYVGMRDHRQGLWRAYHSNWGEQIHEEKFTIHPYPLTPWEYAVGGWNSYGPSRSPQTEVEEHPDSIGERQVIRFDTYDLGPLGLRVLARNVWADPQTQLPVRIRKYGNPNRDKQPKTGDFEFPKTGPTTIHDLNAPTGLPTVTNAGVIDPDAQELIENAKQKLENPPLRMRLIDRNDIWLTLCYRWDNTIRKELYGRINLKQDDFLPLNIPSEIEDLHTWARQHLTLLELTIFDGQYEYIQHTPEGQAVFHPHKPVILQVSTSDPNKIHFMLPTRDQWPYINNVGPLHVEHEASDLPAGCVRLHYETKDLRRDWLIDTQRDYICLGKNEYRKSADTDTWKRSGGNSRVSKLLAQAPSGHWYIQTNQYLERRPSNMTRNLVLLTESQMKKTAKGNIPAFFSGDPMIQKARLEGIKITFWAR